MILDFKGGNHCGSEKGRVQEVELDFNMLKETGQREHFSSLLMVNCLFSHGLRIFALMILLSKPKIQARWYDLEIWEFF